MKDAGTPMRDIGGLGMNGIVTENSPPTYANTEHIIAKAAT